MALMRWKLQHKLATGFLCLLLIASAQFCYRILPPPPPHHHHHTSLFPLPLPLPSSSSSNLLLSSLLTSFHSPTFASHGAPFIRQIQPNHSQQNQPTFSILPNISSSTGSAALVNSEQGYAGPFSSVFSSEEMEVFPRLMKEWQKLQADYSQNLTRLGLQELANASCYLWLTNCYKLANNVNVLKLVRELLGERVVIYGMQFWEVEAQSQSNMELHFEGYSCETVHIVAGSDLKIVRGSHLLDTRMGLSVGRFMWQLEGLFSTHQPQDQSKLKDAAIVSRVASVLRKEDVKVVYSDTGPDEIVVLSGKTIYAIINNSNQPRHTVVMKFASADCKLRDQPLSEPPRALAISRRLPPILFVSGSTARKEVVNDFRLSMATEEALLFADGQEDTEDNLNLSSSQSHSEGHITFLSRTHAPRVHKSSHGYVERNLGTASSPLLPRIKVVSLTSIGPSHIPRKLISNAYDEVVVVVDGLLMHHCAVKELEGVREVRELTVGNLAFLSSRLWHALVAALPETSFLLISWAFVQPTHSAASARYLPRRLSVSQGIHVFEEPLVGLGALEGKTVVLQGGQAYDPGNDMGSSDVVVVIVKGLYLQVLPLLMFLEKADVLVIPMGVPCVLWNTSKWPAILVVLHFHRASTLSDKFNSYLQEASFRTSGRIMRKLFLSQA